MISRVLGIETSGALCRVAVLSTAGRPRSAPDALELGTVVEREGRGEFARHSDVIHALMDAVLRSARTRPAGLDGIAVSTGPGSFTGLRVGLTVAKIVGRFGGIALAGVPTLEAMALARFRRPGPGHLVAVVDARRGEVWAASFRAAKGGIRKSGGPWFLPADAVAARVPAGSVMVTEQPTAAAVAALGLMRLQAGRRDDPASLVPVYLRQPQAVEQRLGRLRRRR